MAVTATDVISDREVRGVLEERTQPMYQFRRAFREHDGTDLNGSEFTFPVPNSSLREDMEEVGEESNYPRTALDHDGITVSYTKEGFEVAISDEAADDTPVDIILDVTEDMALAAEHRLDATAYATLNANQNSSTIGDSSNDLNYEAVVDAVAELSAQEFSPSDFELYCSPYSWADLAKDDNFNRATEAGDELAREGMLGEVFGVPVAMTNTGNLGNNEALLVDTGRYGYESTRWDREVTNYRDEEHDRDVFKVRHRKDFVATKPDACLKLDGGVTV